MVGMGGCVFAWISLSEWEGGRYIIACLDGANFSLRKSTWLFTSLVSSDFIDYGGRRLRRIETALGFSQGLFGADSAGDVRGYG